MSTLLEIRNKVIKALQEQDFTATEIDAEINNGIKYIARKVALTALESSGTFVTEVGIDVVDIPSEWNYQRRLHNAFSDNVSRIEVATSINILRNKYPMSLDGLEEGDVKIISIYKGQIAYFPVPEEAQTITCKFYEHPTLLVEDTDVPTCLPEGLQMDLLKNYALWKIFEIIEDGIEGAKVNTRYYKAEFNEAFSDIDDTIDEGQSSTDPIRENGWI